MGYAGYFSTTNRIKDKATGLQAALAKVPTMETLLVLEKLHYNLAVSPNEAKYRKLKLGNAKIAATVGTVDAAREAMALVGWEEAEDPEDGAVLLLPAKTTVSMQTVRDIQEAQRSLTLKQKDIKRKASSGSLANSDDAKAALREQLENDRRERAAQGPVTKSSSAQALPPGGFASAADMGINGGGCC